MILSDRDISNRLRMDLHIDPLKDRHRQIQPASVDLRLSNSFILDGNEFEQESFTLEPGDFILGSTIEEVEIPADLVGEVEGRSSWGRKGLTIHSTAGYVDPGFIGELTLEISNEGPAPVTIEHTDYICQLVLEKLHSPAERPYGHEDRDSKYQEQDGTVESRLDSEGEDT